MLSRFASHRYTVLLVSLLLLMLLMPLVHEFRVRGFETAGAILTASLFILVLATAIPAVGATRTTILFASLLAGPAILLRVIDIFFQNSITGVSHLITGILFISFAIVLIVRYLAIEDHISLNTINASLCLYLLLGILWANAYLLTVQFDPDAFSVPVLATSEFNEAARTSEQPIEMLYYSFTTLTTLGYGDITPVSAYARMLAITEAVIGQIILVVLVAWLVGLHVSQSVDHRRNSGRSH